MNTRRLRWILAVVALVVSLVWLAVAVYRKERQVWSHGDGVKIQSRKGTTAQDSEARRRHEILKQVLERAYGTERHGKEPRKGERWNPDMVLEKSTNYPPVTAWEQQMWAWWDAMNSRGEEFRYRRPIRFYGRVVDERGNPIAKAHVLIGVVGVFGERELRIQTNRQGQFKVEGQRGKLISVWVEKGGYVAGKRARGTFEFAEFFSDRFYIPDKSNPVEFVLLDQGRGYR